MKVWLLSKYISEYQKTELELFTALQKWKWKSLLVMSTNTSALLSTWISVVPVVEDDDGFIALHSSYLVGTLVEDAVCNTESWGDESSGGFPQIGLGKCPLMDRAAFK